MAVQQMVLEQPDIIIKRTSTLTSHYTQKLIPRWLTDGNKIKIKSKDYRRWQGEYLHNLGGEQRFLGHWKH